MPSNDEGCSECSSNDDDKPRKSGNELTPQPGDDDENLPPEIQELLNQFPESERGLVRRLISLTVRREFQYQAPLPPPQYFEDYDRVRPGTADDIIEMVKEEQNIKKTAIKGQVHNDRFAISVAFVGVTGLIVVAGVAAYFGEMVLASITALSSAAIVAIRSITNRRD